MGAMSMHTLSPMDGADRYICAPSGKYDAAVEELVPARSQDAQLCARPRATRSGVKEVVVP